MNKLVIAALIFGTIVGCSGKAEKRILVFSKTEGFYHEVIPKGIEAIQKLGALNGIEVDTTKDASWFTDENLKKYSAVIFFNTTGDVLNHYQQADFERYIQAGGGYVGVHSAADTEYDWPWYNHLVGAYFNGHPKRQNAKIQVLNTNHESTKRMSETWVRFDEWYNYRDMNKDVTVLMNLDETTCEGGTNGKKHPIAWYHEYDGGKSFYTGGGHTDASYEEPLFLQHILGGINYVIGDNTRDYSQANTQRVPVENRFVREVLAFNLNDPMELEYLPGQEKILFIERYGDFQLYDLKSRSMSKVGRLEVQHEPGEDGLLGMAIDPEYIINHWVYVYYTPLLSNEAVQRLSRFTFDDDKLDYDSEKVLIEIPSNRDCCHSGGSVEFGPDGLLYLSLGDNTNPFASNGYSPSDERPGKQYWDAQRTSGNTNDLRGKILRIKPEPDGTYSIPKGNLFEDDDPLTRPEIYVMGLRNPFRISVDSKMGILYWGDVGPDAGEDDPKRGPRGFDELNQAKHAGNWGWPYTRGNNQPYWDYDFENEVSRKPFDPDSLINNSPFNTGIQNLPPAQPSFIWYPYSKSKEFPWIGSGGRTAMAGPIFYKDQFRDNPIRIPDYFDGKLFFYEWIRDKIYVITLDGNQNYISAEPFMPTSEFHNPVDIVFGDDGALYILEYGEKWRNRNLDAQLNRITFVRGNRNPIARLTVDKNVGRVPLKVNFSSRGSTDFDGHNLTFSWDFGDGSPIKVGNEIAHEFTEEGVFKVTLTATDTEDGISKAVKEIMVGNDKPSVDIELDASNLYYSERVKVGYKINVFDHEDGSTSDGSINSKDVEVTWAFLPEGRDKIMTKVGHQPQIKFKGEELIAQSDCKACHAISIKINGPSYEMIAGRYSSNDMDYLRNKVINGGSGVWGDTPMSAHPQLSESQVTEMITYILSLNKQSMVNIPLAGNLTFDKHKEGSLEGVYILTATYMDKGNGNITPLTGQKQLIFRAPLLEAEAAAALHRENRKWAKNGGVLVGGIEDDHFIMFNDIQFTGLKSLDVRLYYKANTSYNAQLEVRKGSMNGQLLTEISWDELLDKAEFKTIELNISQLEEGYDNLYFVFKSLDASKQLVGAIDNVYLRYGE
ncbi:MAG: ThuA domain-containing protein [Cyclobacteriaceae bacterium]|nr:ThuA domain-containing protein [Cyclobacteriaceae bacterium]